MVYDESRFDEPDGLFTPLRYIESYALILTAGIFSVDIAVWLSYFMFCNFPETTSLFGFQSVPNYQFVAYCLLCIAHVMFFFMANYYAMFALAAVKILQAFTATFYACTYSDDSQAPLDRIIWLAVYCFLSCGFVFFQTYSVFSRVKIDIAHYAIYKKRLRFVPPVPRYGDANENGDAEDVDDANPLSRRPDVVTEEDENTDDENIPYDDSEDES